MQTYNYAEEILKDEEYPLPLTSYVKGFSFLTDDGYLNNLDDNSITNTDEPYKFTTGNLAADKKEKAYEEGIKNDGITIEDGHAGLNGSTHNGGIAKQK